MRSQEGEEVSDLITDALGLVMGKSLEEWGLKARTL